jgi:serine/threonine protein kinase/Tol biopolymer transport system component
VSLGAGVRLGPYDVVSRLGAGGMGEVWRARDSRLNRDVAIKVLPEELSADAGRLKRFEKEARSASALNHPNIVTIYDTGQSDSVSWIAMELVEGKNLRELLFAGSLPVKRVLTIAAQVADGLARAHEAGIVHRDLKPENVMVTKDGRVKILDFGLAKLTYTGVESGEGTNIATETGTGAGVILGTVGYMSPEQASGQPVDYRSDQFSFGSILYELLTGKRAFVGKTGVDTLSAILNDEPAPIVSVNPQVPTPLRWIVERCLAKESDDRYASTRDLARELSTIRDHLSEAVGAPDVTSPPRSRLRRFLLPAASVAVAAAAFLAGGRFVGSAAASFPKFQQLTFQRGAIETARFAPDGQTVLYGLKTVGPRQLFSTRVGSPEYRLLGLPPSDILSVSSAGEIAVLLGGLRRPAMLARASLGGGAPREVLDDVNSAGWSPDGKDLAVVHFISGKKRLEFPIGKVLYETSGFLYGPRVSPKGDLIAVISGTPSAAGGTTLLVIGVDGRKRSELRMSVAGFVWSPSGKEIWLFRSPSLSSTEVIAATLDGRERLLGRLPGTFVLQDAAADGRLLAERVSYTREMVGLETGQPGERILTWLDQSSPVDVSADGKSVLFGERGSVYLRGMDGSPAKRLGEGLARALSPDGKWALVYREASPMEALLMPTGAGEARKLSIGSVLLRGNSGGTFFADGRRILIEGTEPGHGNRLYVLDLSGGAPQPVTPEGVTLTDGVHTVSPDGRFVATMGPDGTARYYPLTASAAQARPIPGLSPGEAPVRWSRDGKSLFFWGFLVDVDSGRRRPGKEFRAPDPVIDQINCILPGPDGKSYVYSYDRYTSDLFLVEGLK